jgi:hypothetical protein
MANLTLAPEDDDSDFPLDHDLGGSMGDKVNDTHRIAEQRLRFRFDAGKPEGRIISPWPGIDHGTLQKDDEGDTNILADGQGQER